MCPRFLDIVPQAISLLGSRLFMSQAAPCHLGIKCNCSFFKQVSAITRNMQEFFIAQACVSLLEISVQAFLLERF